MSARESDVRSLDELYSFVKEHWPELPGGVGEIPSEKLDAIETCFQEKTSRIPMKP